MNYNQLLYLVNAVQSGSIRKAAKALRISQPNLSSAIIALEREIGVQLLIRTNKGISVTPEGRRFATLAQDIVNKTIMLENLYREETPTRQMGILSVATNPSQLTLNVLQELCRQQEDCDCLVTVRNLSVLECAFSVRNLESELGVVFITSGQYRKYMQVFEENQLEYNRVSTKKCCINLSANNPLFGRDLVHYDELLQFPLARFIEDHLSLLDFGTNPSRAGLEGFQQVYYFDSDCSILNFVRQTEAIKFGYPWCRDYYESMGIRCIDFVGNTNPLEVGWIRRKKQELTDMANEFVKTFTRLYAD